MKVKIKIDNKELKGELLSSFERAHFISDDGKTRLHVENVKINICGAEDDNCIWVRGLKDIENKTFLAVDYSFYPI